MIVVIADDISGAAEIAGIGRRFGLTVQVQRRFSPAKGVDVIVVDTNTRDTTEDVARATVEALARELNDADVLWCYKKVDSVLRGHVRAELEVLMNALEKPRTLLAPANPSKGRTIVGGQYRIDNRPLHETDFANDPQCPAKSSLVTDLLGTSENCPVLVLRHGASQGRERGIVVGEAESPEDLAEWAAECDVDVLAAGGSDFFTAILEARTGSLRLKTAFEVVPVAGLKLFICGSASDSSRQAVKWAQRLGIPVCPMPDPLFGRVASAEWLAEQWMADVLSALRRESRAIVAIPQPVLQDRSLANELSTHLAGLVESVISRMAIGELILEGGATAQAVLDRLGWQALEVVGEYGPGIVQLSASDRRETLVTMKPGSYPWPPEIWGQCREGTSYAI
jgi:D-threonate/D-erythronate kinase